MGPWTDVFNALPADGAQVWVRRDWFSDPQVMYFRTRDYTFAPIYADAVVAYSVGTPTTENLFGVATTDPNTFIKGATTGNYFGWVDVDNQWEYNNYPPSSSGTTIYGASGPVTSPFVMPRQDGGPGTATLTLAQSVPWWGISRWASYP
jgi:hypothetical protein